MQSFQKSAHLLFITIAGNKVGLGHLNRCLSLAAKATTMGLHSEFLVFGDLEAQEFIKKFGFPHRVCSVDICSPEASAVLSEFSTLIDGKRADLVLADVVHPQLFEGKNFPSLFAAMRSLASVVAVIDALGEKSLATQAPHAPIDLLVVPYVTEENALEVQDTSARQLKGAQYALLPSGYSKLGAREHDPNSNKVLVTCGGSDPKDLSIVVLKGLELSSLQLDIRVIAGPLFSSKVKKEIADHALRSAHSITLLDAPASLIDHMLWSDIAISASGLTKYELAATGTPALLFSIDTLHDANNKPFAALGSVVDLGVGVTPQLICEEATSLLKDKLLRQTQAANGQKIVDGLGAERLIKELMKELSCSKTK